MAKDRPSLWIFGVAFALVVGLSQNAMGKERVHAVGKKDSLESVAARYGCDVDILIEWNEKKSPAAGLVLVLI